jgi:hypothetical protein
LYQTRSKAVPEEIKFDVRVFAPALPLLTVDNFGFRRMHLQTAFRQARLQLHVEGFRLLLTAAVYQSVIRIPTPWEIRMCPCHSGIERVVKKEVRQNWADHTALRRTTVSLNRDSIFSHHRRFKPSFDVQQRPFTRYMFPDGPQQELVVNVAEQTSDIELQYPVVLPAPLSRTPTASSADLLGLYP